MPEPVEKLPPKMDIDCEVGAAELEDDDEELVCEAVFDESFTFTELSILIIVVSSEPINVTSYSPTCLSIYQASCPVLSLYTLMSPSCLSRLTSDGCDVPAILDIMMENTSSE